jgi:hypothetical protein
MPSSQNLPLAALQQIEAAALQLLSAVRQAGNGFSSSNILPLRPARLSTVADLCNSFLLAKARAGRSKDTCARCARGWRGHLVEIPDNAFSTGLQSCVRLSRSGRLFAGVIPAPTSEFLRRR